MPEPYNLPNPDSEWDAETVAEVYLTTTLRGYAAIAAIAGTNSVLNVVNVYRMQTPSVGMPTTEPVPPYVIFFPQAQAVPLAGVGEEIAWYDQLWTVMVWGPASKLDDVRRVNALVFRALHATTGLVTEGYVADCRLEQNIAPFDEDVDGVLWTRRGRTFRLKLQPA
jgi:hypothetical protein